MPNPDFLATYGSWDIERFLGCLGDQDATLVLVNVRHRQTGDDARRDIGETVTHVWNAFTRQFPSAHGHRLSWADLAFILPSAGPDSLVENVAATSTPPPGSHCEVLMGGTAFPRHRDGRLQVLDEFGWRLAKGDYRREYSGSWFARNGNIEHIAG